MLSGPYLRATAKYLADNGVDPDSVEQVMGVLQAFAEEEVDAAEDSKTRAAVQWPGGADAKRRAMAADAALPVHLRRFPAPAMSARQKASYEARFPGISKIRIV